MSSILVSLDDLNVMSGSSGSESLSQSLSASRDMAGLQGRHMFGKTPVQLAALPPGCSIRVSLERQPLCLLPGRG